MHGIGSASGKFGELLQGELPGNDAHFLVSLPIEHFSIAKFHYLDRGKNITVYPEHKIKSALLVNKIMRYHGMTNGWNLTISSQLAEGKGLGSSTADLVACARAITCATNKPLPTKILLEFLREIEPSDGLMYDGVVCFYHRKIILRNQLGYISDLVIAGVDEGGVIDTIKYNQELKPCNPNKKNKYAILLNEMIAAIQSGDLKKIGAISTKSAIHHQEINPKKNLDYFIDICYTIGASGIIVAHSGTYIGIILNKNNHDYLEQLNYIKKKTQERSLSLELFNSISNKMQYLREIKESNV